MMATLTAIAVAIRPFCAHQPSLTSLPDLGEVEQPSPMPAARPRPWPLLDLALAQIWVTARASSGHGRGRDPCFVAEGCRRGLVDCVVVEGGIGGLCIAVRSPFFGTAFVESESGERLESA
ncbi:hypothetical protein NL676_025402 [Syzygium grande]|nr:hypothetical protein NL676_025402 [Syzygium grande]